MTVSYSSKRTQAWIALAVMLGLGGGAVVLASRNDAVEADKIKQADDERRRKEAIARQQAEAAQRAADARRRAEESQAVQARSQCQDVARSMQNEAHQIRTSAPSELRVFNAQSEEAARCRAYVGHARAVDRMVVQLRSCPPSPNSRWAAEVQYEINARHKNLERFNHYCR